MHRALLWRAGSEPVETTFTTREGPSGWTIFQFFPGGFHAIAIEGGTAYFSRDNKGKTQNLQASRAVQLLRRNKFKAGSWIGGDVLFVGTDHIGDFVDLPASIRKAIAAIVTSSQKRPHRSTAERLRTASAVLLMLILCGCSQPRYVPVPCATLEPGWQGKTPEGKIPAELVR